MKKLCLGCMYAVFIFLGVNGIKDGFIDPFDMENFDVTKDIMPEKFSEDNDMKQSSTQGENDPSICAPCDCVEECRPCPLDCNESGDTQETKKSSVSDVLFRHFIKHLLSHLKSQVHSSQPEEFNVLVKLSSHDIEIFEAYTSEKIEFPHSTHEVLTGMIIHVAQSNLSYKEKYSIWIHNVVGMSIDELTKVFAILACAAVIITSFGVLKKKLGLELSWRKFWMSLLILSFIVSLPMTWFELYKSAQIDQQKSATQDVPKHCRMGVEEEEGMISAAKSVFASLFTFKEDHCQRYYEHMLIDPIFKVPPTKVVSITFVRLFISPLKDIGSAFAEFLKALLIDMPVTLYPVVLVAAMIFFFIFLFMLMGYRISLPLIAIEPSQPITGGGHDGERLAAIEDTNKQLHQQLAALSNTLQERDNNMMEGLRHMERVQTSALEYISSTSALDTKAPTLQLKSIEHNKEKTSLSGAEGDNVKVAKATNIENVKFSNINDSDISRVTPDNKDDNGKLLGIAEVDLSKCSGLVKEKSCNRQKSCTEQLVLPVGHGFDQQHCPEMTEWTHLSADELKSSARDSVSDAYIKPNIETLSSSSNS